MSLRRRALLISLALAALRLPVSSAVAAAPDPGALAHCASIASADERLACYDSLARPKPSPAAPAPSASANGKTSPQAAATPAAPARSAGAATAAPAAAAAGTAATAKGTAAASVGTATTAGTAATAGSTEAKSFGLTKHAAPSDPGPDHIQAKVTRVDTTRLGHVRLSLDNGQAWTFSATDVLIHAGDAITIKRGVLGSFLLTTPAHHTYRAERLQ